MKLLIEQWREYLVEEKKRKNHNEDYPSVKKAKRLKAIGKPDRDSWVRRYVQFIKRRKGFYYWIFR